MCVGWKTGVRIGKIWARAGPEGITLESISEKKENSKWKKDIDKL